MKEVGLKITILNLSSGETSPHNFLTGVTSYTHTIVSEMVNLSDSGYDWILPLFFRYKVNFELNPGLQSASLVQDKLQKLLAAKSN
jgi:hypothetical protein